MVIFPSAEAMYGVRLEGLIAYRSDVKQLYFRDHITWRSIRVNTWQITPCSASVLSTCIYESLYVRVVNFMLYVHVHVHVANDK